MSTPRLIGFPHSSVGKESTCNVGDPGSIPSWVGKFPWRKDRLPTPVFLGFLGGSDGKESACIVGDLGLILGLVRSPEGGHGNPLQYFCLENTHRQRGLAGYSPWGHKQLDNTEQPIHTGGSKGGKRCEKVEGTSKRLKKIVLL